jgi:4-hydroxysphinganine ceramide fatty acyl 2-hydroxylase
MGDMSLRERLYRFRSFWIFPLLAVVLLDLTFRAEPQSQGSDLLWLFPIGVLVWTLLEYGLHRFVFHIQIPIRNSHLREFVNASHLEHHAAPRDPTKVLVRPVYGLMISAVLYGLMYLVSGRLFSVAAVMAGIWAGFLYYEAVHYRVHFSLSGLGFIARQRRAHFYHHFTNNKRCFGVTSPLWDYVFGTRLPEAKMGS